MTRIRKTNGVGGIKMDDIKLDLMGLWLILNDEGTTQLEHGFIHRDYVKEKIKRSFLV